ncbi:HAMP domain-containing sensor histidine kinase [Pseudodesulfovibrio sp. zrk46]|uniref:sensor histidine kinase n=1 Tax=Pseudodesulfovibrio sp. zrk46 TaxID=2725288 RepID=UPI0014494113|nr:HAMP domain-containing sensor histidine kinase [Pseudodesulfovibrio sp. zrk46]QJB55037.1 response regulator [Pseudodesulfovibrio sp. zrk46]
MNDELIFADEQDDAESVVSEEINDSWRVLIVDDQKDVHTVTRLVLADYTFEGRSVECLSAYSGQEAQKMLLDHKDVAVLLLDVVMETSHSGLDVARFVRSEAKNKLVRIILRTGQPGEAPEREVVADLDINDYRQKSEMTADSLVTAVTTAIRSYRDLKTIDESQRGLHLLAMSVAHQVRNRTMTIAGFAKIISRREGCSEEVKEYLETIREESTRLEKMVGDVTHYASIEAAEMVPSNIRDMLEQVMEGVDARYEGADGVEWDVVCPDQTVQVDPALFASAFTEIMQNSVDFSDGRPKVSVTVSPGRLACVVEIEDKGVGISEDNMAHIYDPFFSLKPNGSGMGLCVVSKVVASHQWSLSLNSTLGEGTTVRVVIPRKEMTG